MGTDKYAYSSGLKAVNPLAKLLIPVVGITICITANDILVSLFTVVIMCVISAWKGGLSPGVFLRLMRLPFGFLLLACLTVAVGRYTLNQPAVWGVTIGNWVYGVTVASLVQGLHIFCKSLGVLACVYFYVLNTPMTDLSWALRKLRVPALFIELMELIYRFIFVFMDTMRRIRTAQASRLGYQNLSAAYHSTGTLGAMVFLRAYKKSDKIYAALESRGYTGTLSVLEEGYGGTREMVLLGGMTAVGQLAAFLLERAIIL